MSNGGINWTQLKEEDYKKINFKKLTPEQVADYFLEIGLRKDYDIDIIKKCLSSTKFKKLSKTGRWIEIKYNLTYEGEWVGVNNIKLFELLTEVMKKYKMFEGKGDNFWIENENIKVFRDEVIDIICRKGFGFSEKENAFKLNQRRIHK